MNHASGFDFTFLWLVLTASLTVLGYQLNRLRRPCPSRTAPAPPGVDRIAARTSEPYDYEKGNAA